MKKLFIAIGILFASIFLSRAQTIGRATTVSLDPKRAFVYDSLFKVNDWRKNWKTMGLEKINGDSLYGKGWIDKMLKVGDQMPDLELGTVINNSTGKTRFSDFKGKLIILDFWNTSCSYCIASFPKMLDLQRKFGSRIQIILINTSENEKEIKEAMGKGINKIPDLLSIVDAKYLFPYFPTFAIPYYVWIDQNGTVRIIGRPENIYEQKIQDLLNGKNIDYLASEATRPSFNKDIPYYKLLGKKINAGQYNSYFTLFNNDYVPDPNTERMTYSMDSVSLTKRSTFINCSVRELYLRAVWNEYRASINKLNKFIVPPAYTIFFEVQDSLRYDWAFAKLKTDITNRTSRFCYEQIYPKKITDKNARQMMLEDLNTHFGKLYGTYGRMEKRVLPVFEIVKLQGEKYKRIFSKATEYKEVEVVRNGKKWIQYKGVGLSSFFNQICRQEILARKKVLINETGLDVETKIDIELPKNATLADVKQALKLYGLDIIERNTEMELLVISDTKAK